MAGNLHVNNRSQIQVQTTTNAENTNVKEASNSAVKSLSAGDVVNGKIVSSYVAEDGNKMAKVDIGKNSIIDAKLQNGMELTNGQNITFSVRGSGGNLVTLLPLYENTAAMDMTATKALLAAGLSTDDNMKQMVSEMMHNGMNIDKNSLLSMSHAVMENPEVSVSTIVQMKNLGIEINEANITQFNNYQNYEHQIIDGMNDIIDNLPGALNEMVKGGDLGGAVDMYGGIMKMFADGAESSSDASNPASTLGQGMDASVNGEENAKMDNLSSQNILSEGNGNVDNTKAGINNTNDINNIFSKVLNENGEEIEIAISNSKSAESAENAKNFLKTSDFDSFINSMKKAGIPEEQLKELINIQNTDDSAKLLKSLSNFFENTSHLSESIDKAFAKLFSSDSFNKLLKDNISNQWTLNPGDVGEKKNIKDFYEKLNKEAKELTNMLQSSIGENTSAFSGSKNLSQNLDFMNQMNQMYAYVQLPLKMSGNDTHGDLYVYSNKKHMASEDGSVSALLHLDMNNLGPLDVHVKMLDNKVNTNFYVADDSVINLIESNIDKLNERLAKRGYDMNVNCKLQENMSEDEPVDALLKKDDQIKVLSSTSFDARA